MDAPYADDWLALLTPVVVDDYPVAAADQVTGLSVHGRGLQQGAGEGLLADVWYMWVG